MHQQMHRQVEDRTVRSYSEPNLHHQSSSELSIDTRMSRPRNSQTVATFNPIPIPDSNNLEANIQYFPPAKPHSNPLRKGSIPHSSLAHFPRKGCHTRLPGHFALGSRKHNPEGRHNPVHSDSNSSYPHARVMQNEVPRRAHINRGSA